jgi:hypothetical protein
VLDRFTVPGGWLYRTTASSGSSYSVALAFVPEPKDVNAELTAALAGLIGLVELIIPTLGGSQRIGVEQNYRLQEARAALAKANGATP